MSHSASRLPAHPSLEQLRKQAKELLRAVRGGVSTAVQRVRAGIPRLGDPAAAGDFGLADVQFVLAREYGFDSWADLVHHVEATSSSITRFERLAEEVARAYMAGDGNAVRDINWTHGTSFVWDHDSDRMQRRLSTWYASPSRSIDLALADARHLVAKQSGVDSWAELLQAVVPAIRDSARAGARAPVMNLFYRVDERRGEIEIHGPIAERDWDAVIAVISEMRLTTVKGAGQITDAAIERLARLDHVTSLDLSFAKHLTAAGLRHIARLPLRSLELGGWGTQVDDEALAVLRDLPELRSFSAVWAQDVSDAGIANLAACMELESVNLMGTRTGDGAMRALAGKPRLGHVDAGTRVTPGGLALLHGFPVFAGMLPEPIVQRARASDGEPTHLTLHPTAFVRGGLDALAGLEGIFSLRFFSVDRSIPPMTAAALEPIVRMRGVESLWCDPADDAMAVIAVMSRLRKLMCQDTAASDDGWIALGRSTTIESIWGRRNPRLTGRGLEGLSTMPALRTLGVNLRHVGDGLALLPGFPALRDLTPIGLRDDEFRHVGKCTELETLTCMYTEDIGDRATEHIAGLRRLRKYYAGDTSITDRSLETLALLPALEDVELWSCPAITNAGVAALAGAPRLRKVNLEGLPNVTREARSLFPPNVEVRITG
jgi:hypothetical protein